MGTALAIFKLSGIVPLENYKLNIWVSGVMGQWGDGSVG